MASPTAASSRMLPRLTPLKTRPIISPVASLVSTARSDLSASVRSSASASTYAPAFCSRTPSRSVLVVGLLLSASARIAASRVALSLLASWMEACVSERDSLISVSDSFASARSIAGRESSSAPSCICLAAASRVARSGEDSLSAAIAVASCLRTRLLRTMSSRLSGSGDMVLPVRESVAVSPWT